MGEATSWQHDSHIRLLRNALRTRILISHCEANDADPKFLKHKMPVQKKADDMLQSVLVRPIRDYSPRQLYLMQKHLNEYWLENKRKVLNELLAQAEEVDDEVTIAEELGMAPPTGMVERLAPQLEALENEIDQELLKAQHEEKINDLKKDLSDAKALLEDRQRQENLIGQDQSTSLDMIKQHIQFLSEKLEKAKKNLE